MTFGLGITFGNNSDWRLNFYRSTVKTREFSLRNWMLFSCLLTSFLLFCFFLIGLLWLEFCENWYECSQEGSPPNNPFWVACICCLFICPGTGLRYYASCWHVVCYPGESETEMRCFGEMFLCSKGGDSSQQLTACYIFLILDSFFLKKYPVSNLNFQSIYSVFRNKVFMHICICRCEREKERKVKM